MTDYKLRHGEAVSIGVALDCLYSSRAHGLSREDAHRVVRCLAQIGLPTSHDLLKDKDVLFDGLEEFRQHLGGELTVTMIDAPGQPVDVHEIDHAAMSESINELLEISTRPQCNRKSCVMPSATTQLTCFGGSVPLAAPAGNQ